MFGKQNLIFYILVKKYFFGDTTRMSKQRSVVDGCQKITFSRVLTEFSKYRKFIKQEINYLEGFYGFNAIYPIYVLILVQGVRANRTFF